MKLLKLALLALTLHLLSSAALASTAHRKAVPAAPTVEMAMEPASWVFVAFGLLGGGFLHRRRLPGLNLVGTAELPVVPQANAINPKARQTASPLVAELRARLRMNGHSRISLSSAVLFPRKVWASAAAAFLFLVLANPASADTITFNAQTVPTITLGPSSDTFSLNSGTGTVNTTAGTFAFQTGDFIIGDSQIPDQVIPFSFQDTVTLNGITQTFTLYGQDAVTQTADTLTIFAGTPIIFGNETFSVQNFTLSENAMGDFPVKLQANVTPEPSSLLLLGTGVFAGALLLYRRSSVHRA